MGRTSLRSVSVLPVGLLLSLFAVPSSSGQKLSSATSPAPDGSRTQAKLMMPMAFEANRGQARKGIDFVARGAGYTAYLEAGNARICLSHRASVSSQPKCSRDQELGIQLLGARNQPRLQPEDKLPGYSNYLFGSDPNKWITNVTQYAKVRYANVYPGIDIVYHGNQSRMEHDFVVLPGADASGIALAFSGVEQMELTGTGDLRLHVADGEAQLQKPHAYQLIGNKKVEVAAEYVLRHRHVAFRFGRYDATQQLIIDPVLVYSTFLGGTPGADGVQQDVSALAIDQSGNVYVAGTTNSLNFPVTPGVVQPKPQSAFISKLDPSGNSLVFSTYIEGLSFPKGLAVDTSGNICLAGTGTAGLPIPPGSNPFQSTNKSQSGPNPAILKLNSTATAVVNATYLGGSGVDLLGGLALDQTGNVFVSGTTSSNDFPTQKALQSSLGTGGRNAFVTELNPTLSALVYSTYLGANSNVSITPGGIALDASGNAFVVGGATPGFSTTPGAYQVACPDTCSFFAKLDPNGSSLLYSTYIGNGGGLATAIAVDSSGNAYLAGLTYAASFPVVNPIQSCSTINGTTSPAGNFLAEFNKEGALAFSTCLGIIAADTFFTPALTLDTSGNVYVTGSSEANLPLENAIDANPPLQPPGARPFISEINSVTHALVFSSFVAEQQSWVANGFPGDVILGIAVDSNGNMYLAGQTESAEFENLFPVFDALQPYFPGPGTAPCSVHVNCFLIDGFVLKISPAAGAAGAVVPGALAFVAPQLVGTTSAPQPLTIYDLGTDVLMVSSVTVSGDFAVESNNCGTVPASGGSCTIQVTFTPTMTGTRNGTLTITGSPAGSLQSVVLTGAGGSSTLNTSPTSLSFPNQSVGTTSSPQQITVGNTGIAVVQIGRVQTSGDFAESNNCGTTLSPGASCTINVTFTPTTAGTRTGSVVITDDAAGSPQAIALTGNVPSSFTISTGASPASATIAAGATATYNLSLTANGGFSGAVQFSCLGAPAASNCTVSPNPLNLTGTNPAAIAVSVATTARTVAQVLPDNSQTTSHRTSGLALLAVCSVFGFVLVPIRRQTGGKNRWGWRVLPGLILLALLCFGCGGSSTSSGNQKTGTPSGTYNITVSGSSGSVTQSAMLKLNVQ
jgi:hypothetical protein